jgi:hypothetical protein
MVETPVEKDRSDPHPDRGFDKRIIWGLIVATIFFVLIFLYLMFTYFLPNNPSGAGQSSQQSANPSQPASPNR